MEHLVSLRNEDFTFYLTSFTSTKEIWKLIFEAKDFFRTPILKYVWFKKSKPLIKSIKTLLRMMVKEKLSRGPIKHTACTTVATYFNTSVSTCGCCTSWWKESMYDKSVHTSTSTFASTVPGIGATSSCNPKRNFFFNFGMRPSASRLGWNSAKHFL